MPPVLPVSSPVARLRDAGGDLPPGLHDDILSMGRAAIPELIALVRDEELGRPNGGRESWAPIHALVFLVALDATEAIEPLLDVLARPLEHQPNLHTRLIEFLPKLGPSVFPAALARFHASSHLETRARLGSVLAHLRIRDQRIFDAIKETFDEDATTGAILFDVYGDPAARDLLAEGIARYELRADDELGTVPLAQMVRAYHHLGGRLVGASRTKVRKLLGTWPFEEEPPPPPPRPKSAPLLARRPGFDDPCSCGSGSTYVDCCFKKLAS